jgi:bifunctional DNase/RNase
MQITKQRLFEQGFIQHSHSSFQLTKYIRKANYEKNISQVNWWIVIADETKILFYIQFWEENIPKVLQLKINTLEELKFWDDKLIIELSK